MSGKTIALGAKLDETLNEVARCAMEVCDNAGEQDHNLEHRLDAVIINSLKTSLDKWKVAREAFLSLSAEEISKKK